MKKSVLKWLLSALAGLILVMVCYIYWNAPYTFGSGDEEIERASILKAIMRRKPAGTDERVLAINVSYDRMLVPCFDEWGIPQGETDITHRGKLLLLCDSLAKWNNYRYLVLDVDLGVELHSEYDEQLFSRIAGMDNVVTASSGTGDIPAVLREKSAVASYTTLFSGDDFIKYTYLTRDGVESLALRMWKDLAEGTFSKHWWGYSSNHRLCNVSVIPPMEFTIHSDYSPEGEKQLYQLGADILSNLDGSAPLFEDKIILLGDWKESDMHDTILHEQPGIAILYNAFLALESGKHYVSFWVVLLLFVLFTLEIRILFRTRKETVKVRTRSFKVIHFMELLFGYSTPLAAVCIILYFTSGIFVNTMIIGGIFSVIDIIIEQ